MRRPGKQEEPGYSRSGFERGEPESLFRFHLTIANAVADEAKEDGSPSSFMRCLSHAKVALSVAKKADRPDLEQRAQLAIIEFLELAGRGREAMEARIIAAAMVDNLKVEFEPVPGAEQGGARVASVDGIPIDEVIRLLENDGHEQRPSSSVDEKQRPVEADPPESGKGEPTVTSEPQAQEDLPRLVLQGRQIRDLQGRLATVLTDAPKLRRKPRFNE